MSIGHISYTMATYLQAAVLLISINSDTNVIKTMLCCFEKNIILQNARQLNDDKKQIILYVKSDENYEHHRL